MTTPSDLPPPPPPPAGWYPDPTAAGNWRYWDGSSWGPSAPAVPTGGPQAPSASSVPTVAAAVGAGDPNQTGAVSADPTAAAWSPVTGARKWWTGTPRNSKIALGGVAAAALVVGGVGIVSQHAEDTRTCMVPPVAGDLKALQGSVGPDADLDRVMIKANAPGRVGQEVRDGDFAFVVHSIDACPGKQVKVAMTVTNVKDDPRMFRADNQKLLRTHVAADRTGTDGRLQLRHL